MAGTTKPQEYVICLGILMERFMYGDPINLRQMSDLTGFHIDTIKKYVSVLHRRKIIRICEWHRRGGNGHYYPSYTLCTEDARYNVSRPPYETANERAARYRAKKRLIKLKEKENEQHAQQQTD